MRAYLLSSTAPRAFVAQFYVPKKRPHIRAHGVNVFGEPIIADIAEGEVSRAEFRYVSRISLARLT